MPKITPNPLTYARIFRAANATAHERAQSHPYSYDDLHTTYANPPFVRLVPVWHPFAKFLDQIMVLSPVPGGRRRGCALIITSFNEPHRNVRQILELTRILKHELDDPDLRITATILPGWKDVNLNHYPLINDNHRKD